ncbi:MAG: KEOPS complex subunit Cgi121 [Candidatus Thermoplasmatota archaeon]|nr:KEOPS complex subunit Cgi121 [Candidatus Thermoplasmatota archaeon]
MRTVPWFPAWAVSFSSTIEDVPALISKINNVRPDDRWVMVSFDVIASEVHLWSVWHKARVNEDRGSMVARDLGAEFLRIVSGTRQISTAIDRSVVSNGDCKAWLLRLPELDVGELIGDTNLPVEEYNTYSKEAERIIELLGGSMMPTRPCPSREGLVKIGYADDGESIEDVMLEQSFVLHASMSDF